MNNKKIFILLLSLIFFTISGCLTQSAYILDGDNSFTDNIRIELKNYRDLDSYFKKDFQKNPFNYSALLNGKEYRVFSMDFNFDSETQVFIINSFMKVGDKIYKMATKKDIIKNWEMMYSDKIDNYVTIKMFMDNQYLNDMKFSIKSGKKFFAFFIDDPKLNDIELNISMIVNDQKISKTFIFKKADNK